MGTLAIVSRLLIGAIVVDLVGRGPIPPKHWKLSLTPIATFNDGEESPLVMPLTASETQAGHWVVADASDEDVKVYDRNGRRLGSAGRAGGQQGEFGTLTGAQAYRGDSIAAFDFIRQRIYLFDKDGTFGREMAVPVPKVWNVGVLDDSVFLLRAKPPIPPGSFGLVRLVKSPGDTRGIPFRLSPDYDNKPAVAREAWVLGDGRDGVVFLGSVGGDSLYAFSYGGELIASGPIDEVEPLTTLPRLAAANGGTLFRSSGQTTVAVHVGQRMAFAVTALSDRRVLVQIRKYDGAPLTQGGTFVLMGIVGTRLVPVAREHLSGGLLGRDRLGAPLLITELRENGRKSGFRLYRIQIASKEGGR